jgi:hypothetical protein
MLVADGAQCSHSRGLPLGIGRSSVNDLLHLSRITVPWADSFKDSSYHRRFLPRPCRFCAGRIFIDFAFRYLHVGCQESDTFRVAQVQLLLGKRAGNHLRGTPSSLKSLDVQTSGARRAMQPPALTGFVGRTAQPAADLSYPSGSALSGRKL